MRLAKTNLTISLLRVKFLALFMLWVGGACIFAEEPQKTPSFSDELAEKATEGDADAQFQ